MTRTMPTQIKVQYTRACPWEADKVPGAYWSYYIREANGDVHGFAGGLLVKTPAGNWVAHYWDAACGAPAKTREQAILNVLPLAAEVVDNSRMEQEDYERTYRNRWDHARDLNSLFPTGAGLVSVHDITAKREAPSGEPRFKVTLMFDNLTEAQVILLAAQQQERK